MTTVHHSPPLGATPFSIYEDPEDQEPPSPSIVYDGDSSFHSDTFPGADEPMESIEPADDPRPYTGSYTSRRSILSASTSRRASLISSLPSEFSVASKPTPPANHGESRYTPRKERPTFRNPSSVRALQMSSPPPFVALESPRDRLKGTYKLTTPSRSGRSETPVSASGSRRSGSQRESQRGELMVARSPRPSQTPQQHYPLVLLHVTILPMQMPYPQDMMKKVMPEWLVENYRVLEEKLKDIVLMRRGLLVPHPREEYDVLEETILESLELKMPRLLKCGHFVGPEDDEEGKGDDEDDVQSVSATDDRSGRGSSMSGGTVTGEDDLGWKYPTLESDDASVCTDCHRDVKRPGRGVGSGSKRWDIKIYAANGLMRAGAWSAAWSEMERCDVEISPWIPDDLKKVLEKTVEQEQQAAREKQMYEAEVMRRVEEAAAEMRKAEDAAAERRRAEEDAKDRRRVEEAELQIKLEEEELARQRRLEEEAVEERRLEEEAVEKRRLEDALEEKLEEAKESIRLELEAQALVEAEAVAERLRLLEEDLRNERSRRRSPHKATSHLPPVAEEPSITEHHPAFEHSPASQHTPTQEDYPFQYQYPSQPEARPRAPSRQPSGANEIPLGTLLKNYIVLLARDQRNIAILILSCFVVFLSTNMTSNPVINLSAPALPSILPEDTMTEILVSEVVVTMTATATTTATSVFSTTITHVAENVLPSASAMTEEVTSQVESAKEQQSESTAVLSEISSSDALSNEASVLASTSSTATEATSTIDVSLEAESIPPSFSSSSSTETKEEATMQSTPSDIAPSPSWAASSLPAAESNTISTHTEAEAIPVATVSVAPEPQSEPAEVVLQHKMVEIEETLEKKVDALEEEFKQEINVEPEEGVKNDSGLKDADVGKSG